MLMPSLMANPMRMMSPADEPPVAAAPPAGDSPAPAGDQPAPAPEGAPASLISGETAAPPVTPEEPLTIDSIKAPEGVELNAEQLTSFLELMNTPDLTRAELAQKLVDYQVTTQQAAGEAANAAAISMWDDTQSQWQKEVTALPEIGGNALPATLATIKKGLMQAGATKATFEALDLTGAGNHPEMVRILHSLTKGLGEAPPVQGSPPSGTLSQAERLFAGRKD